MIDIHSHIIPNVDDGSIDLNTSINLLEEEIKQGVTDIILTPHYRKQLFEKSNLEIINNYNILKESSKDLPISLYLGREIYCRNLDSIKRIIDDEVITMNNTNYVLIEFSYTKPIDISEVVYELNLKGFNTIIAHIERYQYLSIDDIIEIKNTGALIQINASSIVGCDGFKTKRKVLNYINKDLIDFVASDVHFNRANKMDKAYKKISSKFSKDIAEKLFVTNQIKYLKLGRK